ncbi:MAG: ParB N-terminal domain-containing protein [Proteobacteria bacterium]|nr:ParB N-terminal domain-containing protein [Pseudomonadota bacterium]
MKTIVRDSAARSELLPVARLHFDQNNPRFPPKVAQGPLDDLMQRFVRDERLMEIVESIGNHGFFPGEPLLVVPDSDNDYRVVEGNRRLAALKLLVKELKPPLGRTSIEEAVKAASFRPSMVPCLVFDDENEILRYLGFRHITGIKAWSALQKARYAERMYQNYKKLPQDEGLRLLARETGSRRDTVGQMLTALKLYDHAEEKNFFGLPIMPEQIEFSVLGTALSYSALTEFLGLESRSDIKVKGLDERALKDLFDWLFVIEGRAKPIVTESRNLRKLAAVVSSDTAIKELRKSGNLDQAYELSSGPEEALVGSLRTALRRLEAAQTLVPKVPKISDEHMELADGLVETASAVQDLVLGAHRRQNRSTTKPLRG